MASPTIDWYYLCSLVGEHLDALGPFLAEVARVLAPGGRLVFSVYHPAMAEAGSEANFEADGVVYRLGAVRHSVEDYRRAIEAADLVTVDERAFEGDEALVAEVPRARKYLGFPVLLVLEARR